MTFKKIPNAPNSISVRTAARWMKFLTFQPKLQRKGYYKDGHNRPDIVEYRDNEFLPRMLEYERRMQEFSGANMETVISPELLVKEKRVVLITHDENTFYCCELKPLMWMESGQNLLLPKSKGTSIMVSGLCCDCHGFFSDGEHKSYTTFEAGKNRCGWFTNKDLVEQFNLLLPLIRDLHQNCETLIAFDNSMTHHAKVSSFSCNFVAYLCCCFFKLSYHLYFTNLIDELYRCPADLNLKMSEGKSAHSVVEMRSGKYIDENGIEHVQSMQYPCGKQKGVKQILIERGNKHKNDQGHVLNLQCNWCKGKVTDAER